MPANKENNQVSGGQSLLEKVFRSVEKRVFEVERVEYSGTVTSFDGQVIESSHFPASIGSECVIKSKFGSLSKGAVIGFRDNKNIIFQYEKGSEIFSGDSVTATEGLKKLMSVQSFWGG